jgi:hypothetical protein
MATLSIPRRTVLPKPWMNFPLRAPIPGTVREVVVVYRLEGVMEVSSEDEGINDGSEDELRNHDGE